MGSSSFFTRNPTPTETQDVESLLADAQAVAAQIIATAGQIDAKLQGASDKAAASANSAQAASNSAMAAAGSQKLADGSAQAAALSASTALDSAHKAADSAQGIANSVTGAQQSAQAASNSAGAAAGSEANALSYQGTALTAAQNSSTSQQAALQSEKNAKASETNAKGSETNSATSEGNAKGSADRAAASEGNAKTSETNAGKSASAAAQSASDANGFRGAASGFADAASTSAAHASTSEGNAKTSESNALKSAQDAASAQQQVATALAQVPATQYADLTASGVALPFVRTNLERHRDGVLSIMNWIDPAKRTDIQNRVFAGTLQNELQSALNSGENLGFNKGTYPIAGTLTQTASHQKIIGMADRRDVRILVDSARFNMQSSSILTLQHYGTLEDITIECEQPQGGDPNVVGGGFTLAPPGQAGTALQIKQYPWAIDVSNATNVSMSRVQLRRTYNGILGNGNCGDLELKDIEDGSVWCGLYIDGALNFVNVDNWKSWVYLAEDLGQYRGLERYMYDYIGYILLNRIDALSATSINMWKKRVSIDMSQTELASTIDTLKMDGGGAHVSIAGGRVNIGSFNGLSDLYSGPLLHVSNSGRVAIGQIHAKVAAAATNPPNPLILMDGAGSLSIAGGCITGNGPQSEVMLTSASGGVLQLENIMFDGPGSDSKPTGEVYQTGGRLFMHGCHFGDSAAGTYCVYLNTNDHHNIAGNFMGGRKMRRPTTPYGYFAGNTGLAAEEGF